MLAQKWDAKLDPTGWWMSGKLDGVRGYWDGKNFYSRLGNQFPAPEWFKRGLPKVPLDGELWCGRRQFRRCLSIVRNRGSGDLWEYITYLVFDAPAMKEPYEERVAFIKKVVVPIDKPDRNSTSSSATASSHGTP
jgi:DNA ligase-1